MPSILSRLRTRAVSQSSRQSAPSVLPAPTPSTTVTTPTPIVRTPGEQPASEPPIQETAPVTRKIYPDLDLLPEELVSEPPPARRGLPPPVRRGLLTASNIPTTTQQPNALSAPGDTDSPKASRSSSPSGAGDITPSESGFIQRLGNWSTFGRRRAPPPSLNEFGEHISPSPSAWRTRRANSRLSSRPSSKTTTSTHSSPHENKESTPRLSSQSSSGRRTPAAAAARSNSYKQISTPVAHVLGFDSPRTLGNPSPEVAVSGPSAPPPPVPPLDHPALHSQAWTATFPPRARSADAKNNGGAAPIQYTFGRSLRPYRSLPRVQHIFRTRSNKSGDDEDNGREGDALAEDGGGDKGDVPVPTVASWPIKVHSRSHNPPTHSVPSSSSSPSSSPSSSDFSNQIPAAVPVGPVDTHDPIAPNLYDPKITLFDNAVPMQQDAPRVRDKKPLRSSLKASARPSPLPIASSSSSNANASTLMPSFSLVAAAATASDSGPARTPVSSPGRSETSKGKRKAEDVDTTPPDSKKATFAVPASPREHISSLAPSSYHNKRARLSGPSPSPAPPTNAHNTGTYSSRTSSRARAPSSTRSATGTGGGPHDNLSERERRRSLSQRSIPISALVTPQVPSVGRVSSAYHMRDPRRPPRRMETGWALRFRTAEEEGSPVQAWLFYLAFVPFPLWWVGAVWRVPQTRVVGGTDTEKAVPLDDPQIEFDARSWRFRCRIMSVIALFTYIPFIVCIAIFAGR